MSNTKYGLTLSNRSVVLGMSTIDSMLDQAREADKSSVWDSVWLGDSILAKPRLDAMVALGGIASVTNRVKLGVGCMASTPLRDALLLAYQWSSLDYLSNGRTIFVACQGQKEAGGGLFEEEFAAFGIDPASKSERMEEAIKIMRQISMEEKASFHGKFHSFDNITILPRPIQNPLPIWVTANPNDAFPKLKESALRRVARLGDGWMTTANTVTSLEENLQDIYRYAEEENRSLPENFEICLYYNVHVTPDRGKAITTVKNYLMDYYGVEYPRDFLERWVAIGCPSRCIDEIQKFSSAGATTITLRLIGYDEQSQFERVTTEVLPKLAK